MKFFTLILFMGISVSVFSQTDFDKRLLAKFSQEQITDMAANHPEILNYWTYYLDHSYEIVTIQAGKDVSEYPEIKFKSSGKFNILTVDASRQKVGKTHYRIKNSNQLLVLDSTTGFTKKYNAYRAKN